jgi:hypothetical protein
MKSTWCTFYSIYWESRASTSFEHPEDEQVMLETCRGPWFSINWMKSASRWFHYTDIIWCTVSKTLSSSLVQLRTAVTYTTEPEQKICFVTSLFSVSFCNKDCIVFITHDIYVNFFVLTYKKNHGSNRRLTRQNDNSLFIGTTLKTRIPNFKTITN